MRFQVGDRVRFHSEIGTFVSPDTSVRVGIVFDNEDHVSYVDRNYVTLVARAVYLDEDDVTELSDALDTCRDNWDDTTRLEAILARAKGAEVTT